MPWLFIYYDKRRFGVIMSGLNINANKFRLYSPTAEPVLKTHTLKETDFSANPVDTTCLTGNLSLDYLDTFLSDMKTLRKQKDGIEQQSINRQSGYREPYEQGILMYDIGGNTTIGGLAEALKKYDINFNKNDVLVVQTGNAPSGSAQGYIKNYCIKSDKTGNLSGTTVDNLGILNREDYHNLSNFIKINIERFPAKNYTVVIYNSDENSPDKQFTAAELNYAGKEVRLTTGLEGMEIELSL